MTTTEVQNLLTGLMRGIDKKTAIVVEPRPDPNRPGVTVHLARDKRSATLELCEDDLLAGQTDLMRRNRLRTQLKRAHDRMWEQTGYIFSTRTEHQRPEAAQFFRSSPGGRGRRH